MKNIKINNGEIIKVLRSEVKKRKRIHWKFQEMRKTEFNRQRKQRNHGNWIISSRWNVRNEELFNKVKVIADASTDKSLVGIIKAAIVSVNGKGDEKRIFVIVKKVLGIN